MYKCITLFFCKLQCIGTGIVVHISMKDDFCAVAFRTVYFDQRSHRRHNDCRFTSEFGRCISNSLRMVSCGSSDQSSFAFFFTQCADLIIRTTHLISTCILHIFRFQIDSSTGLLTQIFTVHQLCRKRYFFYNFTCLFEFL